MVGPYPNADKEKIASLSSRNSGPMTGSANYRDKGKERELWQAARERETKRMG